MSKDNPRRALLFFPLIVLGLVLTVSVALQPQRLLQFASEDASPPPFFGCIHLGEADPTNCGTKMGSSGEITLSLYGRPFNPAKDQVYYGDRLSGSLKYTNVGSVDLKLLRLGLGGQSTKGNAKFDMFPYLSNVSLAPKASATVDKTSHVFDSKDNNGQYGIGPRVVDSNGLELPTSSEQATKIKVNATCTALRNKELTAADKTNLKAFCGSNPKSRLCASKEYCQIMKGGDCPQGDVAKEEPNVQCDQYVYMPKPEQDMLESFCKVYPDSDTCENFCGRTIGTSLCPKKYLFIDTTTGKAIRMNTPRSIYVRDPDNFKVNYSADYPIGAKKFTPPSQGGSASTGPKAVAGISTTVGKEFAMGPVIDRKPVTELPGETCTGAGGSIGGDGRCCSGLVPDTATGVCGAPKPAPAPPPGPAAPAPAPAPAAPAGAPAPAAPGGATPATGCDITVSTKGCKGGPGQSARPGGGMLPAGQPGTATTCVQAAGGGCVPTCNPGQDPVRDNCLPSTIVSDINTLETPGGAKKADGTTAGIANGHVANGYLPCNVDVNGPLNPALDNGRRLEHAPTCNTLPNGQPDPGKAAAKAGEMPTACKDLSGKSSEVGCEYLCKDYNNPNQWAWCNKKDKPVMGQMGYNSQCKSGLKDSSDVDDPFGVEQHACCAKGNIPQKDGCCGSVCGVWKMEATVDPKTGNVSAKNLRGHNNEICANPDKTEAKSEDVVLNNSCKLLDTKTNEFVTTPADFTAKAENGYSVCDLRSGRKQEEISRDPVCKTVAAVSDPKKLKELADKCMASFKREDCEGLTSDGRFNLLPEGFDFNSLTDAQKAEFKDRAQKCMASGKAHLVFIPDGPEGKATKPMCVPNTPPKNCQNGQYFDAGYNAENVPNDNSTCQSVSCPTAGQKYNPAIGKCADTIAAPGAASVGTPSVETCNNANPSMFYDPYNDKCVPKVTTACNSSDDCPGSTCDYTQSKCVQTQVTSKIGELCNAAPDTKVLKCSEGICGGKSPTRCCIAKGNKSDGNAAHCCGGTHSSAFLDPEVKKQTQNGGLVNRDANGKIIYPESAYIRTCN